MNSRRLISMLAVFVLLTSALPLSTASAANLLRPGIVRNESGTEERFAEVSPQDFAGLDPDRRRDRRRPVSAHAEMFQDTGDATLDHADRRVIHDRHAASLSRERRLPSRNRRVGKINGGSGIRRPRSVDDDVVETEGERESEAKLNVDMHRPALWRVVSASATNKNGYPTSYQLAPGMNVETLLTPDDYPRRRAGFIDHHLRVTPYQPGERFAAGDYPTLSKPGEGLPKWTASNRSIANADIVLWYTLGMHHVARAEDWPVMPVAWNGFELRPFDFFDRNPALTLPKQP